MMAQRTPVLQVENISKRLGGKQILKNVSLDIGVGELKLLIGPSGGGKSTLLQCINFLIRPDEGRVLLDGHEIDVHHKQSLHHYRQKVGMIFQDFNLFDHLTALDNVSIAPCKVKKITKAEAVDRARYELDRVGLKDKAHLYPAELSGGQKQRVSIARALAMDPKVIMLDEPTSALDPELIGEVLQVIRNLAQAGMTMLMATHQIGFAKSLTHEILFMENGAIIERGAPQVLLESCENSRTSDFCSRINELIE